MGQQPGSGHDLSQTPATPVSIRVSPHNYLVAIMIGTFFSSFSFYIEADLAGVLLFCISWIILPFFALNDRVVFDGRRLRRVGVLPTLWTWFNGSRPSLKLTDIEQVESHTVRSLRRGGNIYYRYRTAISGKGLRITVASGGDDYRRMIRAILPLVPYDALDSRSVELRDHLADPKETLMKAEFSRIPSSDALETSINDLRHRRRDVPLAHRKISDVVRDTEKADDLRDLANELHVGGFLLRSLEAFRRALVLRPSDARLLFEFARCLHAFAGVERDVRMERTALAAMRLAERRAADDADLLERLGECYFQLGEWRRAAKVFQNTVDSLGERFRVARGMAEIALREGKIAHVIHHFSTAGRVAQTPSLRRWSNGEAEYFARLNDDDEYMEMEIGRVNLLETIENSRKTALRIMFFGFPAIVIGIFLDDSLITNLGWAVSCVSLMIWTGLIIGARLLGHRIPYELMGSED